MASVVGRDLEKALLSALHLRDLSLLPSTFYVGLGHGVLPTPDASLLTLPETSGPGYSRWALPNNAINFPSLVLSGTNDWKIASVTHRYENSGPADWTAADWAFLTDVPTGTAGKFFGAASVTPFLLHAGDTFDLAWETVSVP